MAATSTGATELKDALAGLHRLATIATADVPGDVPSLIAGAFHRQFREEMPSLHDHTEAYEATTGATADKLLARLAELPPLEPNAQLLLDRAHSILTSGPPLSMNVELADGEELPVALHTLLQGTLWAIVGQQTAPDTPSPLWFLCKKTLFTHSVATRDAEHVTMTHSFAPPTFFMTYAGRLLACGGNGAGYTGLVDRRSAVPEFGRVSVPPVIALHTSHTSCLALTARGLFGWGENTDGELGLGDRRNTPPTRVAFPHAPAVCRVERALPVWHGDRLSTRVLMGTQFWGWAIISTPGGVVAAGILPEKLRRPGAPRSVFTPVIGMPSGVRPSSFVETRDFLLLMDSEAGRALWCGADTAGRLGGDGGQMGLTDAPVVPDHVWVSNNSIVLAQGRQLVWTGEPGPLPRVLSDPADPPHITLPADVTAVYLSTSMWCFVRSRGVDLWSHEVGTDNVQQWSSPAALVEIRSDVDSHWICLNGVWHGVGSNFRGRLGVRVDADFVYSPTPVIKIPPVLDMLLGAAVDRQRFSGHWYMLT
ncbi:hypothetical protein J8273_0373 [Carpediemonas membranifera]|uniref:Regulator of chromosome condensation (RCC1) repeat-containing protein n=1 Tax=Carpediemonas membranifera TaxID=201153 RepID=A0A8J6E0I1_9EUKA|nr:hypothetical protein J8273_0373 [Carpediemonas membranifera]|eukprot:KAG9395154.1 hypothetical protein J8273_0373 [Carpediemonas membranifera]